MKSFGFAEVERKENGVKFRWKRQTGELVDHFNMIKVNNFLGFLTDASIF